MLQIADAGTVKGKVNTGKQVDYDYYVIEVRTAMSTQEVTVCVGFADEDDKRISGDIIAYGEWGKLDTEDCVEYLKQIKEEDKMLRDYSKYLNAIIA